MPSARNLNRKTLKQNVLLVDIDMICEVPCNFMATFILWIS